MHLKKHGNTAFKLLIQLSYTYSYSKCSTRLNHLVYVIDNVSSLEQKLPLSPAFLPSKLSSSSILNMKLCESYTISICFFSALVLFKIQNKCFHFGAKIKNHDCFFNYFKNWKTSNKHNIRYFFLNCCVYWDGINLTGMKIDSKIYFYTFGTCIC